MKGRPKKWTKRDLSLLRKLYPNNSIRLIASRLKRGPESVKSKVAVLGLKHAAGYNRSLHSIRALTKAEITFIRNNYVRLTNHELAAQTGRSESSIQNVRRQFNLHKENSGCIKKGTRPWNKGSKGLMRSTPAMRRTQFKKGHAPRNTLYDGAITIRLDHPKNRKGRPYKWIRVSKGKWMHLHRWKWIQKYGPVPASHIVVFKNGDTMDVRLSNLELMSMSENARRNHNPEKAWRASRELSDNYVAGRIAGGDKKLRKAIILGMPELVELKRTQLKLKRQLNEKHNAA